ncbi:MAG: plasmid stabilization protein [Flavobacterium sp. BFFFF1]|uniref:type II toxin-antitoxin system RelE/ParE family toxin n=1 Tax=Flavobacterium sp. BFFFF1 TaxID=2015557 RepID=UPI000BDAC6E5|nr:type II toxin-antitoxin system RelE/ParE family toxin [Flavobacterium sp. BFFFF1]OYU78957.1 MAG: plasmid stabilization protein [Flavobacterium sp. BFFFF1]
MAKFHLLHRAVEDLADIWDYTFDEWSERQADKYYQLLIDSCQELAENPNLGKSYNQIANNLFAYKSGEHLIFYFVISTQEIEVVRILHGRMDLKKKFQ